MYIILILIQNFIFTVHFRINEEVINMSNIASPGTGSLNMLERIEVLERHKENLDKKWLDVTAGSGKTKIGLTFAGMFTALVTINGVNSDAYATYLAQGYGYDGPRMHIVALQNGNGASFEKDPNKEKITFNFPNTSGWACSVLMIQGNAPTYELS